MFARSNYLGHHIPKDGIQRDKNRKNRSIGIFGPNRNAEKFEITSKKGATADKFHKRPVQTYGGITEIMDDKNQIDIGMRLDEKNMRLRKQTDEIATPLWKLD